MYYVPFVLIAILYIIIYVKLKSQKIHCEQSVNAGQQRQQRERNVLKLSIAIVLPASRYIIFVTCLVRIGHMVLRLPILYNCCPFHGPCKLCHKSLHLFYFQ